MRISDWSSDVCSSDLINSLLAVQSMLPSIFISHGAPRLALGDSPARSFLESLPALLPFRPTAILIISAPWEERIVTLHGLDRTTTIHVFGGFPDHTYELRYQAPGAADRKGGVWGT